MTRWNIPNIDARLFIPASIANIGVIEYECNNNVQHFPPHR
ncbi:MAG: hypothetical protein ACTS7E_01650 [Arsenophonus sp. NC-CH8-MAG3]